MTNQTRAVPPEETICIIKECAAKVYNVLGPDYREETYEKAMEVALRHQGLEFETQRMVPLFFEGVAIRDVRDEIDLVVWAQDEEVETAVVVDFKAVASIDNKARLQVARYQRSLATELEGTGKRVYQTGLVINFPKPSGRALSVGVEWKDSIQFLPVGAETPDNKYTEAFWDSDGTLTPEGADALDKLIQDREKALEKERAKLVSIELLIGLGSCLPQEYEECQDLRLYVQEEESRVSRLREHLSRISGPEPEPELEPEPESAPEENVEILFYTQDFWDDKKQLGPEGLDDLKRLLKEREKDLAKKRNSLVDAEILAKLGLCPIEDSVDHEKSRREVVAEERIIATLKERLRELEERAEPPEET